MFVEAWKLTGSFVERATCSAREGATGGGGGASILGATPGGKVLTGLELLECCGKDGREEGNEDSTTSTETMTDEDNFKDEILVDPRPGAIVFRG